MDFPKFLVADNTDLPEAVFIVHTEFPAFVLNLENDEVKWLELYRQSKRRAELIRLVNAYESME